jgi:hypothetical protein
MSTNKNGKDDWGIGAFFLGCFLIPFSLVWIWKNEKKIVRFHEVIVQAEESVNKDTKIDAIDDSLEFKLVHMRGKADNKEPIKDETLDYQVENCYRLVRTVEMYQTKETKHEERDDNDNVRTHYTYEDGWFSESISSNSFDNESKRKNNPTNAWPFKSDTKEAKTVKLGEYQLAES